MSRVEEALRRLEGTSFEQNGSPRALDRGLAHVDQHVSPAGVEDYPCEKPVSRTEPTRIEARLDKFEREKFDKDKFEKAVVQTRELPRASIAAPRAGTSRTLGRLGEEVEGKIVVDGETSPVSIEQYRRLAATLHQLQVQSGLKTVMISSALPRDGKTLTSTNLALTLSESYKQRVLLIDADLRKPSLNALFQLPNGRGLADGLRSEVAALPLIEVTSRLTILPAGTPDRSPMAGLTSDRMGAILSEAAGRFDWVLIDTPPIGLISDASLLARHVDGVLLVIGAGSTNFDAVKRAISEIGRERIIGVVLNRVQEEHTPNEYYHNYYTPAQSKAETRADGRSEATV